MHLYESLFFGKSNQTHYLLKPCYLLDNVWKFNHTGQLEGLESVTEKLNVDIQEFGIMEALGVEEDWFHFSACQLDANSVLLIGRRPLITALDFSLFEILHECVFILKIHFWIFKFKRLFDIGLVFINIILQIFLVHRKVSLILTFDTHSRKFVNGMTVRGVVWYLRIDCLQTWESILFFHDAIWYWGALFFSSGNKIVSSLNHGIIDVLSVGLNWDVGVISAAEPVLANFLLVDGAVCKGIWFPSPIALRVVLFPHFR